MPEPAPRRMTLQEFQCWDDGTDTHYELVGGFPRAMAPAAEAHRMLAVRLVTRIDGGLARRRPCNAQIEAGVIRPDRADIYFEADIAATCAANKAGRQAIKDPFLIVEILSPSTERFDRRTKLPVYREIETVEEIVLLACDDRYAEVHRRSGAQWVIEILRGAEGVLTLATIGITIRSANSMTESRSTRTAANRTRPQIPCQSPHPPANRLTSPGLGLISGHPEPRWRNW